MLVLATVVLATGLARADGPMPAPAGQPANLAREPQVTAAADGSVWAVGTEVLRSDPPTIQTSPDVWRSTDHGQSFQWVGRPFTGAAAYGDGWNTDLGTGPVPAGGGPAPVYVVKNGIHTLMLASSADAGATWNVHPLSTVGPLTDRPWLSVAGTCELDLAYDALDGHPLGSAPTVHMVAVVDTCSPANTAPGGPLVVTRQVALEPDGPGGGTSVMGRPATDPVSHRLYVPFLSCSGEPPAEQAPKLLPNGFAVCGAGSQPRLVIASSSDRSSFSYATVAPLASRRLESYPFVATDGARAAYVTWMDRDHAWLARSTDGGASWSSPVDVSAGESASALLPTVAAGRGGSVVVAWYGTDRPGDPNSTATMGAAGAPGAAPWSVRVARSHDGGAHVTTARIGPVVHTGQLCDAAATGCNSTGGKNLFSLFGVALTGPMERIVAVYTDDPDGNQAHSYTGWAVTPGP